MKYHTLYRTSTELHFKQDGFDLLTILCIDLKCCKLSRCFLAYTRYKLFPNVNSIYLGVVLFVCSVSGRQVPLADLQTLAVSSKWHLITCPIAAVSTPQNAWSKNRIRNFTKMLDFHMTNVVKFLYKWGNHWWKSSCFICSTLSYWNEFGWLWIGYFPILGVVRHTFRE